MITVHDTPQSHWEENGGQGEWDVFTIPLPDETTPFVISGDAKKAMEWMHEVRIKRQFKERRG